MSFNQSKSDKSDSSHYRKSSRSTNSTNQRNFSGGNSGGKGGGGNAPPPHSNSTNPSLSTNRSFKKSNGQGGGGGQSRVGVQNTNQQYAAAAARGQNGAYVQPPISGDAVAPGPVAKPANPPISRSTRPVPPPKAPSSQSTTGVADSAAPATPAAKAEMNKSFQLQFGTISPGVVNGMQIPARTSSAPPNLDEQKRDQARHDSFRAAPTMPISTPSKQPQLVKDVGSSKQSTAGESHASSPPVKRDVPTQSLATPSSTISQKPSVLPLPQFPVQMQFSPQVPVPFGAPNSQIQPQNITSAPLQMQIPLSVGGGGTQQVFVPTLQSHQMQTQGMIPQGQNMNFTNQVNHQMPPQMGNIGMGMSPQFSQQALKFGGVRKTVKITHPDTHEELRLDKSGSSGNRSHPNAPSQSPQMPPYAPHHINYYPPMQPSSYNSPMYYPTPQSAVSLNSTQLTTGPQVSRYNYSVGQVPPTISIKNPSTSNPLPTGKSGPESLTVQHSQDAHVGKSSAPLHPIPLTTKPTIVSYSEKVVASSAAVSSPVVSKGESTRLSNIPKETSTIQPHSTSSSASVSAKDPPSVTSTSASIAEVSAPAITVTDDRSRETITRSESFKDRQKKVGKKDAKVQLQNQEKVSSPRDISKASSGSSSEAVTLGDTSGGLLGSFGEPLPHACVISDVPESATDSTSLSLDKTVTQPEGTILESQNVPQDVIQDVAAQMKQEHIESGEEKIESTEGAKQGTLECAMLTESTSSGSSDENKQAVVDMDTKEIATNSSDYSAPQKIEGLVDHCGSEAVNIAGDAASVEVQTVPSSCVSSTRSLEEASSNDLSPCTDRVDSQDVPVSSSTLHQDANSDSATEAKGTESAEGDLVAFGSKDKPSSDTNRVKGNTATVKRRRKDILKAADAAGSSSDLYMAYKGPEEKQDNAENIDSSSGADGKQQATDGAKTDAVLAAEDGMTKAEPDDWEDAADLSTPKLKVKQGHTGHNDDGKSGKKYSRDFLLTLSDQCTDLPADFEIGSDIADSVMNMHPSAGRNDRPGSGPRQGRGGGGMGHDDKWNKSPSSYGPRIDGGQGNFRPGQGGNPRNPRGGGILGGPSIARSNSDADKWQHKGLIPSPQRPAQIMHKAERKYEIRKVSDIEEAKQRQLKAILNKLTPQNFEKLFEQVKEVNIDNAVTLAGVISQIFDKALSEPTFCEMYANFCAHLAAELPDFSEDNEKITFKRLLLNKCQEEFERGEREQAEADKADEEGEVKCSDAEREEKRIQVRRRMLGNIRLIGELYKKRMLTERIMHECIKKLLGEHQHQNPDEEDVEALCKLMSTIGEMIDHAKAKTHMDAYFEIMTQFSNNMKLSSRVRFMLKDSIDLRRNKWQQRRKVEGPKKIDEVHRDAAQERHAQATRLSRGPSMGGGPPSRRGQPMDFGPRGIPSPNSQMGGGGPRGYPSSQGRYGQDVRMDERQQQHPYESRTLSMPLSQRPIESGPITLGPQGGLARGMSVRGQPMMPGGGPPLVDIPPLGDPRRFVAGPNNGYNSPSDWSPSPYPREEITPRYGPDSRSISMPNNNTYLGNRDFRSSMDPRTLSAPPPAASVSHAAPDKGFSEEHLRNKSISTIKEYYSVRDKNEVALCIRELNAPNFYPSIVCLWVSDSFERKDMERELLSQLLVHLTKPGDSIFNSVDLIKGFESVLATLEDAVNDAPRATEFLGRILARAIVEDVVPLREIGRVILEGGEEPGLLRECGLAGDVIGSVLEVIKLEKGVSGMVELLTGSNLNLDDFRPPDPIKSKKLEAFL